MRKRSPKIIICLCNRGCWEWQGCRQSDGYGSCKFEGKTILVHRLVLEQKLGRKLLENMQSLHSCDNPPCVNPDHLWEGSQKENINDRDNKNRTNRPVGESNHFSKFKKEDILQMRQLLSLGTKQKEVARIFNTSEAYIQHINTRLVWKHI